MKQHAGRRYLISGATSGIGEATARALAGNGAELVMVARSTARLNSLAEELPGTHHTQTMDLTEIESIPGWVTGLARELNGLHGVVHAAGIHRVTPIKFMAAKDMQELYDLNVVAGAMLIKGFRVKGAHAPGASAVLLSSAVGMVGQPGVSAYASSKGALISLTKSLALELAREDIRVNCVCPGVVRTPMTRNLAESIGSEAFQEVEAMHPLGLGQPEDVAAAISFLLAPESRWITGAAIPVDGGYTAQ